MSSMSDFIIENGVLKKYVGPGGDVVIPEGVTEIGNGAFSGKKKLTSMTIPEHVTKIGNSAFSRCDRLVRVTLSTGITEIGKNVFYGCSSLESVTIPDSVTSIGRSAFFGCSALKSVTIPESVTSIGHAAFQDCGALTSVKIPESVTHIGDSAFYGCSSLESVTIPKGVTSIGDWAFRHCRRLESMTIPEGVTRIGDSAFRGCSALTSVTIPESVTHIGNMAFHGCSALKSVVIPESVTNIGDEAFRSCAGLADADGFIITRGVLHGFVGSGADVVIPESVTRIGDCAFWGCSALTSVRIPEGVTEIGEAVFSGCSRLAKLVLPESLESIGKDLIWERSATDISIPDISRLPASLRINALRCFMKDGAPKDDLRFESHCKYIKANAAKLVEQAIKDKRLLSLMCAEKLITPKNAALYVEAAQQTGDAEAITMMLDYQANKISAKQKESLEKRKEKEQDTITERMAARRGKAGVEGLNIAVTGKLETFEKRDDLKKLLIEKGAKLASGLSAKVDYLIMNDPQSDSAKAKKAQELGIEVLTEREFNEKIDRIFVIEDHELKAYYGNGGDVTIPAGVTSVWVCAFSRCRALKSVRIPEGVTSIGDLAFSYCSALTSVTIPASVTSIGKEAFGAMWQHKNLTIYAPAGSYAEQYAKEHNIPFEAE